MVFLTPGEKRRVRPDHHPGRGHPLQLFIDLLKSNVERQHKEQGEDLAHQHSEERLRHHVEHGEERGQVAEGEGLEFSVLIKAVLGRREDLVLWLDDGRGQDGQDADEAGGEEPQGEVDPRLLKMRKRQISALIG